MKAKFFFSVRSTVSYTVRWFGPVMFGLALSQAHAATANTTGDVYVGGGLSVVRASGLGGKVDGALANQGVTSTSSADSSSTNNPVSFVFI